MRPMLIRRDLFRVAADLEFLEELGETINQRRGPLDDVASLEEAVAEAQPKRKARTPSTAAGGD